MKELKFDWDIWNSQKNEIKHGVSKFEAESTFFDEKLYLFFDQKHSSLTEKRYIQYAKSIEGRVLMVGFTLRGDKVRIITARLASRKERQVYEEN